MSNCKEIDLTPIADLMEVFPLCQKVILNTVDFKELGLTRTQFSILLTLAVKSPLTMSELAVYIASSKEQATRAVAPLVNEGYLERIQDESNRKLVLVRLTSEGKSIMEAKEKCFREAMAARISQLSSQDREDFIKAIRTTLQILKKLQ